MPDDNCLVWVFFASLGNRAVIKIVWVRVGVFVQVFHRFYAV